VASRAAVPLSPPGCARAHPGRGAIRTIRPIRQIRITPSRTVARPSGSPRAANIRGDPMPIETTVIDY